MICIGLEFPSKHFIILFLGKEISPVSAETLLLCPTKGALAVVALVPDIMAISLSGESALLGNISY
jgi:hypothetical protein